MKSTAAWYHHFWPWFIVILLGVSVVASLSTVVIAYGLGDLAVAEASVSSNQGPTPQPQSAPDRGR